MITRLYIQNYAIIEEVDIDFTNNLNIITGETGAGKSIIVGALGLIFGDRADSNILINDNKKCTVEAVFLLSNSSEINQFLVQNEWEESEELIIRREIYANGKSRGFINDSPATLQQLKQLSQLLVDLHQQFDTQELNKSDFQRQVVDALAANDKKLVNYQQSFLEWQQSLGELKSKQSLQQSTTQEASFNQFLFDEINNAGFKENELEEIEQELQLLNHAENIKTVLSNAFFGLEESDQPVVQQLKQMANSIQPLSNFHPALPKIVERLISCQLELKDVAAELDQVNQSIHFNADRIEVINERISIGYKLLKKHQLKTTNELLQLKNELEQKLFGLTNLDQDIELLEKQVEVQKKAAISLANELTAARKAAIQPFEKNVNQLLAQVGMPNARIQVSLHDAELNMFGKDKIEFLFDANKSNHFEPLRKVASGGELNRLMLCIKSLVAKAIQLPTLIFDEIDTGIGGEAAKQVANIMKQLGKQIQIISITHQPQIAGKADKHFYVFKETVNHQVRTNIKVLDDQERIVSIAQMLGGEKPSAAALENAKEMMA